MHTDVLVAQLDQVEQLHDGVILVHLSVALIVGVGHTTAFHLVFLQAGFNVPQHGLAVGAIKARKQHRCQLAPKKAAHRTIPITKSGNTKNIPVEKRE